jgi:chromate transporter
LFLLDLPSLGAPYIERLRGQRFLNAALSAITAAVVGVVLNLAVWFSLHTLFGVVTESHILGMRLHIPAWHTIDWAAGGVAAAAFGLTFYWKRGMAVTLAVCAALGLALYFAVK